MRNGTALDAVLISLGANAEHGKRREAGDYRKAYDIACRYKLVPRADSDAVAKLLRCSIQWARNLTAEARERERAEREEAIARAHDEGMTNRAIAREHGVAEGTVRNVLSGAQKGKPFVSAQAGDEPDPYADFRVSQSPAGQRWHRALEALRAINAQAEVSAMFADRHTGVDRAIEPAQAKVKAELRRGAAHTAAALHEACGPALAAITPQDAAGFFRHAGYSRPS